ncbi:MAG: DMT family transporter [Rhizobacter sp.]|nr:DMT family transporter [Rhizobacter sp.]
MRKNDLVELVSLAALWGASFLFMRLGAAEFGPVALSFVRVLGASVLLLPLLASQGRLGALRQHWRPIFVVGLTNSALPFMCFNYAALTINAGLSAVFNAASPLFGALIAWLWLRDRLTPPRVAGLFIGFAGVLWLVWDQIGVKAGAAGSGAPHATSLAVLACMAATLCYGFSASYTKRYLTGAPPMAVAAGSQLAASLLLVLPAWWWWPAQMPDARAWSYALVLAVACTGLAYLLYFRLIAHVGPANAISVTFLIPVFAVVWGGLFLHEAVSLTMALGCAVILLGTSLATGVLKPRAAGAVRQT